LAANRRYMLGENTRYIFGESAWYNLGENYWYIIGRKLTEAGLALLVEQTGAQGDLTSQVGRQVVHVEGFVRADSGHRHDQAQAHSNLTWP
jgi:hypothetical protein